MLWKLIKSYSWEKEVSIKPLKRFLKKVQLMGRNPNIKGENKISKKMQAIPKLRQKCVKSKKKRFLRKLNSARKGRAQVKPGRIKRVRWLHNIR